MFSVEKVPVLVVPSGPQAISPCPEVPLTSATTPVVRRVSCSGW
jgi:hypothetical protein